MAHACTIPDQWPQCVRAALLNVAAMTHWAVIYTRSWCANSSFARVRLAGNLEQAEAELALLREELRIKDARMRKLPAHNRPFYPPTDRLAILELKAARAWNLEQTAKAFLLEPHTVASWLARIDEQGEKALVRVPTPVNKLPEFVAHTVQRLKALCPVMGKKRIAETLARAGLKLATTSVGRMLKRQANPPPPPDNAQTLRDDGGRVVTAKHPNHVWHVDLTTVPTLFGFWIPWLPFALPQVSPFCYWVAFAIDHFSRNCMGFRVFQKEPSSVEIRRFLGHTIHATGTAPKHMISDQGPQFACKGFKRWCKRRGIKPRFGAVGKYGSIAVIERFIRSFQEECVDRILVPFNLADFRGQVVAYLDWFNRFRPHQGLGGRTPEDVYTGASTARPAFDVRGPKAVRLDLVVTHHREQPHLPIVELRKAG